MRISLFFYFIVLFLMLLLLGEFSLINVFIGITDLVSTYWSAWSSDSSYVTNLCLKSGNVDVSIVEVYKFTPPSEWDNTKSQAFKSGFITPLNNGEAVTVALLGFVSVVLFYLLLK